MTGVVLSGKDLHDAYLQGAPLEGIKMQDTLLKGAQLQGADLQDADLIGADLSTANLANANLRGTELQGARFDRASVEQVTSFAGAQANAATRWPAGFLELPIARGIKPEPYDNGNGQIVTIRGHEWPNCLSYVAS